MKQLVEKLFIDSLQGLPFLGFNQFIYDEKSKTYFCEIKVKGGSIYLKHSV